VTAVIAKEGVADAMRADGHCETIDVRRVLVVANPKARGFSAVNIDALRAALIDAGVQVDARLSREKGEITEIARENGGAFDVIVVHGGDGSVNEAVAGLRAIEGERPAIALLPGGTVNVLALETAASFSAVEIAAHIKRGRTRPLHYGLANGQPFVLMASAGLDAAVVHRISPKLKSAIGRWAYVWAALGQALAGRGPDVTVTTADETISCRIAICANAARYGGDFVVAPETSAIAPGLRLVLVMDDSLTGLLRIGWRLMLRRGLHGAHVRLLAVDDVTISADPARPAQVDGDAFGTTPVHITIAPAPLRLIVGARS
jgi:diacylglycerol kinase (ATP)